MILVAIVLAAVVGLAVGVLLNALADYLPPVRQMAVMAAEAQPPSAADDSAAAPASVPVPDVEQPPFWPPRYPDDTPRPVEAWSGLWAFIGGLRSAPDERRLSWRYPLVEAGLMLAYGWLAATHPLDVQTLFYAVFLAFFMLITVIDMEHRLILFVVIVPACLLAVLAAILIPYPPPDLKDALLGGGAGFGLFFLMFLGGVAFSGVTGTGEIAFGFGDVLLGMLSGLLLGWQALLFAVMITVFAGAAGALLYLLSQAVNRAGYSLFTALPYGPYIVIGTVIMMLWREEVRAFLLR